jgi:ABC-2 type transport system ATP-binding protein
MNPPTATTTTRPRRAAAAPPPVDDDGAVDAVIETRGLTKVYPGGVTAVDGLDLVVRRGEIFGLLGPNGAGKTTTAGMLTTRVIPTSGSALVGGIDVVKRPAEAKRLIGVVPQSNTLDRSLTVWENLFFHGRFFGMDAKTARSESTRLLEQFRLTERSSAPVAALSGGMAQRLMVARAVMHRPSILFLDEPTAGLDPQSRIALWEILGELHVDGQTILLTTHYMEEADQLCDRVAIIDQGRVVALDTPTGLKRSVGADTTVKVTADGDLEQLATVLAKGVKGATDATVVGGSVVFGVQGAGGVLPAVVQVAEKAGFTVTDLSLSETTLETVFISLTGKDLRE